MSNKIFVNKVGFVPYLMWSLPLLFFTFQFILRLWPGLLMGQIMEQFAINASSFGLLAAAYYYGYSAMQIPAAILLERYGARVVVAILSILCGLATLLFTYTDSFIIAILCRFMVGIGSAVGFLGVSKVISQWFPQAEYTRMVGLSFSVGLLGAVYGGRPVNYLIATYPWQLVASVLAFVSIVIGIVVYSGLSKQQMSNNNFTSSVKTNDLEQYKLTNFSKIFFSKKIWVLALANLLMVGCLEGFADVWGVQYLCHAFSIEKGEAAGLVSFVFVGMLFGGPLLAYFSKKYGNYMVISASGLGLVSLFSLLLSTSVYNWYLIAILFFALGILCCYQVIVFAAASDYVSNQQLGVTIAFLNCINMLGGSFFHTVIGVIMDIFWQGVVNLEGVREYSLITYKYALSSIPVCAFIGSMLALYLTKSFKQPNLFKLDTLESEA